MYDDSATQLRAPTLVSRRTTRRKSVSAAQRSSQELRLMWKSAWWKAVFGIRLATEYKLVSVRSQMAQRSALLDNTSIQYMLRILQPKYDDALPRKIHEYIVLRDNPMSAGREEALDMIIKLMSLRIRSFTRFNHLQKRRICEIMRFESYPESALILKEGHPVTFMYFLVNGQVELFQIREGTKYRVGLVNPGDTFGEVHMLPALRTESIATTMPTEVLIVYQNDFFEILKMQDPNHRAFKENLLAPVFDQFLISRAIESFQIITFEPSETILFEGVGSIFMFWVLNGACDARKTITFVRKRGRSGNDYVKGPLMPYDGERVLAADEETMQQVLTVRTLEQGNHVPNMPAYGEDLDLIVESTFNKNRYVENVRQLTVSSPELASFYTVVARSKATLAKISLYEFAFHASPGLLLSLLRTAPALPSVRELQEAFIEKVNWEQYRRKVVGEVHSQRPHS